MNSDFPIILGANTDQNRFNTLTAYLHLIIYLKMSMVLDHVNYLIVVFTPQSKVWGFFVLPFKLKVTAADSHFPIYCQLTSSFIVNCK